MVCVKGLNKHLQRRWAEFCAAIIIGKRAHLVYYPTNHER